jgi:NDP-sugar pyrophosphorylase family protein
MKAMILAAGFGMRLRPLTQIIPKPLIDINGKPVIVYTLEALKQAGVKDVVINLHHLGQMIKQTLGNGSKFGMNIQYSPEIEIQGTGGALLHARRFLNEPFYLINGDILFDLDLRILPSILKEKGAQAVICSLFTPLPDTVPYIFTGIQFLKPEAISYIPTNIKQPSTTIHMYPGMLNDGKIIAGYIHNGLWIDIGTPQNLEIAKRLFKK